MRGKTHRFVPTKCLLYIFNFLITEVVEKTLESQKYGRIQIIDFSHELM